MSLFIHRLVTRYAQADRQMKYILHTLLLYSSSSLYVGG